jgi:hypothetical protein
VDFYVDHLDIRWHQVTGLSSGQCSFMLGVDHVEKYRWSFDPIIRDQSISDGLSIGLLPNWAGQLSIDPAEWDFTSY